MTLPCDSGPKLAVEPALGGKFVCCLIIVVIFIGLGKVYGLGGDMKFFYGGRGGGGQATKGLGNFFMRGVDPSRHHVNI